MADDAQPKFLTLDAPDASTAPRRVLLQTLPFVIGRAAECSLVLPSPYVSRIHAEILEEGSELILHDLNSRHGSFVNGERVTGRRTLRPGDAMQFGSMQAPCLRVETPQEQFVSNSSDETRSDATEVHTLRTGRSDLEKLLWFLEAAQELNSAGKVERIYASLLETTLALAGMDRGFVFLQETKRQENGEHDGTLTLALGLDAHGNVLEDSSTISHTVLMQAAEGTDQYVLTDTLTAETGIAESILIHNLRTILCIPLRKTGSRTRSESHEAKVGTADRRPVFGVLYLDSSFQPHRVSEVDHDLLRTIAREAAALVENAQLAVLEDQARQQKEELQIAAQIQQRLMAAQIPSFSYAEIQAQSIACHDVGGDFFDVIALPTSLAVALVDVSGKGVSAAILASTLQGMLFTQLSTGQPLTVVAADTNRYLCAKNVGKYATMLLARLHPDGTLEYLNCGHIQPRICRSEGVERLTVSNLPVGLIAEAQYESGSTTLTAGDRIVMVSDGFTEAENSIGEFFGEERFDHAVRCAETDETLVQMAAFCAGHPATDDITIVQLKYLGAPASER
ncbi:MAG: SpoIIE family protein phosphatase [Acidobacteriaceae bacterium]